MKKNDLKVSVIVRTYNSANFVCFAIDSALNQTLDKKFYEIVVIDDGSKDTTLDILKKYGKKIRLIKQKHLGPTESTNNGILKSRGQYIALLDSDDYFVKNYLEKMIEPFLKNKSIDYVYCDYLEKYKNKQKKVSLKNNIFKTIATAIMFKKELFNKIGFYDKKLFFAEYDLLIRIMKNNKKGKYIPIPLYVYVRNENSLTFNRKRVEEGMFQLGKKYGDIVKKIRKY